MALVAVSLIAKLCCLLHVCASLFRREDTATRLRDEGVADNFFPSAIIAFDKRRRVSESGLLAVLAVP